VSTKIFVDTQKVKGYNIDATIRDHKKLRTSAEIVGVGEQEGETGISAAKHTQRAWQKSYSSSIFAACWDSSQKPKAAISM
jgi:hypothetical protein